MAEASNHYTKGFSWHSKSWYGQVSDGEPDHVQIGFYAPEGGTPGEFKIQWERVGNQLVPRLKAYDDGWRALADMPELIELMAELDSQAVSIDHFVDRLLALGFQDLTKRERPAGLSRGS